MPSHLTAITQKLSDPPDPDRQPRVTPPACAPQLPAHLLRERLQEEV
jgi:hypothetical protein